MRFIEINEKKIESTDEQVAENQKSFKMNNAKLSDIAVGETFKIGKYEFIVLDRSKENTAVILKDLLYNSRKFGANNNYNGSNVDRVCNKFAKEIRDIVGTKNLIEHTVDLTSDDGLKDYGEVRRYVSLLTANAYRRYVEILDKYKIAKWWWLTTPESTPTHESPSWVKCVQPRGDFGDNVYCNSAGVRPFCILNSNIFVSDEG